MSAANNLSTIKRHIKLSEVIGQTLPIKKQTGDQYLGKCPFHSDNTPSFRVYDDTGRYWCFGCQAGGDVFDWLEKQRGMNMTEAKEYLGVSEIIHTVPVKEKAEEVPVIPVPTTDNSYAFDSDYSMVHYYRDENGLLLYKMARHEKTATSRKYFLPATHTDKGWIANAPTEGRVMYGLHKLKKYAGIRVVVAGEKKCDELQERLTDNAVLSWSGGDASFHKADWKPINDDVVIYWPDNHPNCVAVQHELAKVCRKLYVIPIPVGMPVNWDCGDAISDGWTNEQIMALINKKVLYEAEKAIETSVDIPDDMPKELPITESNIADKNYSTLYEAVTTPEHLFQVGGLVGRIMRWMNDCALFPLPELELGGATAVTSIIYGHKFKTKTNFRTNLLIAGICTSGAGKDHVRKCIRSLLRAVGRASLLGGKPKSGAAILTMAARNMGRCLWMPDEMGRFLQSISGKNSPGYQQDMSTNIMELFSSSNTTFQGEEVANRDGRTPRVDIDQPCFSMYGVSTKDNLYAAMNSKQAADGFLSRMIIFELENPYREEDDEVNIYDHEYDTVPPEELVEEIMVIEDMACYNKATGSPEPVLIPYTEDALGIINKFHSSIRKKIRIEGAISPLGMSAFSSLWSRTPEMANKFALCAHENREISAKCMQWGIDVATFCTEKMIRDIQSNISDNEHESNVKRVLACIRAKKGITRSELTRKTQWLRDNTHRDNILKTLLESKQIESLKENKGTNNAKERFYLYSKDDDDTL